MQASRRRGFHFSLCLSVNPVSGFDLFGLFRGSDIEADDYPFRIRQISYDLSNGDWQTANKSGDSQNLVVSRQGRILDQINHFDVVAVLQKFVANLFKVGDCRQGFGSLPSHIQAQIYDGLRGIARLRFSFQEHLCQFLSPMNLAALTICISTLRHIVAVESQ